MDVTMEAANPHGGNFTSFQRLGPLANRTTIDGAAQTIEIS
ncbi:hypothetical protein [Sulfitobacter sp. M72]|nr:hypothetical protein [Sulfitobacter sp. M72]